MPSWPFHLHIHFGIGIFSLPRGAAAIVAVADIERSKRGEGNWRHSESNWSDLLVSYDRHLCPAFAFANQCPSALLVLPLPLPLLLLRVIKSSSIKKRTLNERFLRVSSVDATLCEQFCLWGKQAPAQLSPASVPAQQFTLCVPIKQIKKQPGQKGPTTHWGSKERETGRQVGHVWSPVGTTVNLWPMWKHIELLSGKSLLVIDITDFPCCCRQSRLLFDLFVNQAIC